MSLKIADTELAAVSALPGAGRYSYAIKRIADWEELWGLRGSGGWTSVGSGSDHCFPVWPAQRYAAAYASAEQDSATPTAISLDNWLDNFVPGLTEDKGKVAVFPVSGRGGVVVEPQRFANDLLVEFENYEE